jgi:hypothetical protein
MPNNHLSFGTQAITTLACGKKKSVVESPSMKHVP